MRNEEPRVALQGHVNKFKGHTESMPSTHKQRIVREVWHCLGGSLPATELKRQGTWTMRDAGQMWA